ncbi:MAG: transposase [Candidatus Sigynarchaeota archaeon]
MMATCCSPGSAEGAPILIAGFDPLNLAFALSEAKRVREKIPRDYGPIARFFVIMRPFVRVFLLARWDWSKGRYRKGIPGRVPIPKESMLLIHLISHLGIIRSYRQVCEEIAQHEDWMRALKTKKAPDHTTLCRFRKEAGPELFDEFFAFSIVVLKQAGGLTADTGVIVDSAPIEACVNFARANKRIKIDEARMTDFLEKIEISRADVLYPRKKKGGTRPSAIISLLMIFYLCRFLSRSQMLREVAS